LRGKERKKRGVIWEEGRGEREDHVFFFPSPMVPGAMGEGKKGKGKGKQRRGKSSLKHPPQDPSRIEEGEKEKGKKKGRRGEDVFLFLFFGRKKGGEMLEGIGSRTISSFSQFLLKKEKK